MKVAFSNNTLVVDDNEIKFDHPISEIIETKKGIIVRLKALSKVSFNNIYMVNSQGEIKWRINVPGAEPDREYYFTGMMLSDEILQVGEFDGYSCKVRLEDGVVYDSEFTK